MYKDLKFWEDLRGSFVKWVDVLAKAVVSTLGPKGRNVIFWESQYPTITKDWVTVASQITLEDQYENMGVMMAREAAENTNREAWDGTTSTIAILRKIISEGSKKLQSWINPVLMKKGMDLAASEIVSYIDKRKVLLKTDKAKSSIATISANNDKNLGNKIASTIKEVWENGVITVSWGLGDGVEVEYVDGFKIDSGYESHMVINDRKRLTAELEDPALILTTDTLSLQSQMIDVVQTAIKAWKKNLVIVAESIEWTALAFLLANHMQDKFSCIPIKMSSFGDYQKDLLYDLSKKTGATVLWDECPISLKDASEEHFGKCKSVLSTKDYSVVLGAVEDVSDRIDEVRALLKDEKDIFKVEKLKERLGKLTGKIANIKILTSSETEQTEIKYRVEDAINATRSAIEDGVVTGAWTALLNAANSLKIDFKKLSKDEIVGAKIVLDAIKEPFYSILRNAWVKSKKIEKILMGNPCNCYNVLTWRFVDSFEWWIIDPAKCVKNEVLNSVSAASILLTSEVWIINK